MDPVKDQYEAFPYPLRDPADEDRRLITGSPSGRDEINHYLFGGARNWRDPFRVLVAGGGTGDALIMLAQQLADAGCPAEIIYMDLSEASRAIAEARAARRGLTSISFVTGSLLTAAEYGPFDYIDCCGVLHHLPDPDEGFRALKGVLKPEGGMGVMVYGELGRTGVYDAQNMLRDLTSASDNPTQKVEITKRLLTSLPDTNRLKRNPFIADHKSGDAGIYDLLLHSQDRAYRVPQIYDALERANLEMVGFVAPSNYDPDFFIEDAELRARLARLAPPEREAFAELLAGNIKRHQFYCTMKGAGGPSRMAAFAPEMVPVIHGTSAETLQSMIRPGPRLTGRREGLKFDVALPARAAEMIALCDGDRRFAAFPAAMTPSPDPAAFYNDAEELFRKLHGAGLMLLKESA
jgi:SAM-dependent methyltransferase